ncbi:hypothetical protein L6R53_20635 [Myxococcota bacterium]|nr:hypothetical protein [Myxococcota bacterium]
MTLLLSPLLLLACGRPEDTGATWKDYWSTLDGGSPSTDGGDTTGSPVTDLTASPHPEIGALLVVTWTQAQAGDTWVEVGLDGEEPLVSPSTWREPGAQEQVVIGLPYASAGSLRVLVDPGDGAVASEALTVQTDPLPETAPAPLLHEADDGAWAEGDRWLLIGLSSGGEGWEAEGFWKLILDRRGRVVWAHETPDAHRTFYIQPAPEGDHILWDESTFWTDFDLGKGSLVHRMTLDGAVSERVEVPGLHHTFLALPDGVVVWGGHQGGHEVLRERAADGSVRRVWDCSEHWQAQGAPTDCDGNALFWREEDDSFLFSSDAGHSIAQVDRATGQVTRTFGQLAGSYAFAEGTPAFWKQHSPTWTDEGTLLLSTWTGERNAQIVAREYAVDDESRTLTQVWTCGDGTGTTGQYGGEAHRLANGNTLLNYGEGGHIREYTPDCTVIWHLEWPGANLLGRAVFLDDLYAYLP